MSILIIISLVITSLDPYLLQKLKEGEKVTTVTIIKENPTDLIIKVPTTEKILTIQKFHISPEIAECILKGKDSLNCFPEDTFFVWLPKKLKPLLNISAKSMGISYDFRTKYTGKGALVGIIDTGVYYSNRNLRWSDGSSKIYAIWDQTVQNSDKNKFPAGFTYGIECKDDKLKTENNEENECPPTDPQAHGTHIAGIFASEDPNYKGITPESLFIFVKTDFYENTVQDAVEYVFSYADKFGIPAIVNLSLGGHFGPHDGTTPFELAITKFLKAGRVITAAAGNESNKPIHTGDNLQGNTPTAFGFQGQDKCSFEIWTEYGNNLTVYPIIEKNNEIYIGTPVSPQKNLEKEGIKDSSGNTILEYSVDYFSYYPYKLSPKKSGIVFFINVLSSPTPTIYFVLTSQKDSFFDAWISEGEGCAFYPSSQTTFFGIKVVPTSPKKTIAIPATSPDVIAVGSYVSRKTWTSNSGGTYYSQSEEGDLSKFSSWGYIDEVNRIVKPDVTAPGEFIISLCSDVPLKKVDNEGHCESEGTSQASAHIGGLAAILLSQNNELTTRDIIDIFSKSAKRDNFTGEVPNERWGWGKADANNAMNFISIQKSTKKAIIYNLKILDKDGTLNVSFNTDIPSRATVSFSNIEKKHMNFLTTHNFIFPVSSGELSIITEDVFGFTNKITQYFTPASDSGGCSCSSTAIYPSLWATLLIIIFYFFRVLLKNS